MSEMKVWMTPEVEVQNFQANEYVSACYTSTGASISGVWWLGQILEWFITGSYTEERAFFYDASGVEGLKNPADPVKIEGNKYSMDSFGVDNVDHNSGLVHNEVWKGTKKSGSDWQYEKVDDLSLFTPAQGDTVYVGTFHRVDEQYRGVAWS